MDSKRKRGDELMDDSKFIQTKFLKEKTSHELRSPKFQSENPSDQTETPKRIDNFSQSTPTSAGIQIVVTRALSDSKLHKASAPNGTPNGTPRLTPNGTGRRIRKSLTLTPSGLELSDVKTPKGSGLKLKTPKSLSAKKQSRLWCSDCAAVAGSGCAERFHHRMDLEAARQRAAAALRTAQDTLQRLDELVQQRAPRLRCTVTQCASRLVPDDAEAKDVEIALASTRLAEHERRALCAYLEGLVLDADWDHLSASSAGCEAIATKCAKLPDRPEGVVLKPGAILLLGTCDRGLEDAVAEESDASDEDDRNKSWLGNAPPALRIYYEKAVMPHQGRGAKVLGYIKTNLSFIATAKPRSSESSSEGEEPSAGLQLLFSNVTFI